MSRTWLAVGAVLILCGCGDEEAATSAPATGEEQETSSGPGGEASPGVNLAAYLNCMAGLEACGDVGEGEAAVGVACAEDVARCAREALPPAQSDQEEGQVDESAAAFTHPCLPNEAAAQAMGTVQLLLDLEAAMRGWQAPETAPSVEAPEECVTSVAGANDSALARRAGDVRDAERERQRQARAQAQDASERLVALTNIAWSWDPGWESRQRSVPEYGCWHTRRALFEDGPGSDWRSLGECLRFWRGDAVRRLRGVREEEAYMLDGERVHPALTRRLADTELNPGTDQFCMVRQAEDSDTFGTVTCDGLGIVPQGFRLIVPEDAISASGPLARVMVGDLVRVHGHGVIRKVYEASGLRRSGRSSSRWQIEEIPAEGISIAVRSTCCSAPVPEAEE